MKFITYRTEKKINEIKKIDSFKRSLYQSVAVAVYDNIFIAYSYYGATLKELEQYLGYRLSNKMQIEIHYIQGIHGIEYITNGNLQYVGTCLSYLNIEDFNLFVKSL